MATSARQKRPNEVVEVGVDFTARLVSESMSDGNTDITVSNALTDADATSTILVSGSKTLSGNILSGRVQAGSAGDLYTLLFKTGPTTALREYEKTVTLEITDVPNSDNLLAERDELKRLLNITDNSEDQLLDELLLSSSRYLRSRCAREFHLQTYTERFTIRPPEDQVFIQLAEWPVQQIDQIVLSSFDGTLQTVITDQTTYKWDWKREGEIFFRDGTVFERFPAYSDVTYRAGYPTIPDDLREACKRLGAWMYASAQSHGLVSHRIGDFAETFPTLSDLPAGLRAEVPVEFVESVIQRYQRRDFAWMP